MSNEATTTDHPLTLEQMREADQRLRDRRQPQQITELPDWYAAKLTAASEAANAPRPTEPSTAEGIAKAYANSFTRRTEVRPITITYETAAELFYCYLKAWLKGQPLRLDRMERPIIQNLIRWAIQDPRCEWELTKGIYLFGRTGTGKSMLMSATQYVTEAARLPTQFSTAKTALIAKAMKDGAYEQNEKQKAYLTDCLKSLYGGTWCFDDLGEDNEPISVKLWGQDEPVMSPILSHRYDLYTLSGTITHATSNLKLTSTDPDETTIETRYGTRIKDRLKTMFNFILLDGDSRRG
jgi:predicted ATPase